VENEAPFALDVIGRRDWITVLTDDYETPYDISMSVVLAGPTHNFNGA
jgi:hypothetical protein